MQQCMKSDISSTHGTRAVVPALRGQRAFGFAGRVRVPVRGVVVVGRLPRGLSDALGLAGSGRARGAAACVRGHGAGCDAGCG